MPVHSKQWNLWHMVTQIFYLQGQGHNPVPMPQGSHKAKTVSFSKWQKEHCEVILISSHFLSKNNIKTSSSQEVELHWSLKSPEVFCQFILQF